MDSKKKFLICGGDLRQIKLADQLAREGYDTAAYGFGAQADFMYDVKMIDNITEAIKERDIIVLPLPCSCDGDTVNMPLHEEKLKINELFKCIGEKQIVIAGKVSDKIKTLAEIYNILIIDYFQREELTVLNAIPTAEGAIQIAMEELPITIHGANCLILGFGRIGKLLARALHGLGANTTVEARKYADIAWIKAYGYNSMHISDLDQHLAEYDLIVNTIPYPILDEKRLMKVNSNSLIIDLASRPGGVDFDCAARLGKKVIWALSLPGNVAPITAGIIIKDTIFNILEELGV